MPHQDEKELNYFSNLATFDLIFAELYRINHKPRIRDARHAPEQAENHPVFGFRLNLKHLQNGVCAEHFAPKMEHAQRWEFNRSKEHSSKEQGDQMRIQMTVTCGWETMWEKMISGNPMMDGVLERIEERGELPNFDSLDPQERDDAEWIQEMSTGREWARRMDVWTKQSIIQHKLVGELLSYEGMSDLDYPEPLEGTDDLDVDELTAPYELDPEMDEKVQIENFKALLDRMDSRGGIEPDPTSDDEQEREDALWLAEMRVARAIYEKDRCESSKAKVDMMSRSRPSR